MSEADEAMVVFRGGRWRLTAQGRRAAEARSLQDEAAEGARIGAEEEHRRLAAARLREYQDRVDRNRAWCTLRNQRRRALLDDLTEEQWQAIKADWGHRCAYCGKQPDKLTKDHVVPVVAGGPNTIGNIVPACQSCNSRKGPRAAPTFVVVPGSHEAGS